MSDIDGVPFRQWAALARPRLRRTAYLFSGDWHLAEDLTQETLVRVYSVWHRVAAGGLPDAYATRTLVNAHRAALRRPWRREHLRRGVRATLRGGYAVRSVAGLRRRPVLGRTDVVDEPLDQRRHPPPVLAHRA